MTDPETAGTSKQSKPGVLERLRARWPWFDHVMRAQTRYNDSKGDFYAAGITYFTIFSLFPVLMVAFAVGGFVLAGQPELMDTIEERIRDTVSGDLGNQLVELMDSAIASRASVGIIGLATAAWAGLGWMNNLREALSQMWGLYRIRVHGFLRTKLSDLLALLSLFVAFSVTIALTALGNTSLMERILRSLGINDGAVLGGVLKLVSLGISLLVSWLLFTWMIARLPRESASFASSVRAGLLAAVGFEIFKQVASIYLAKMLTGPAGATFGPVLGLMVFAYITARLILFATAWAATATENMREELVEPPPPAVINNRVIVSAGLAPVQAVAAGLAGAVGMLGISRLRRRAPRQ